MHSFLGWHLQLQMSGFVACQLSLGMRLSALSARGKWYRDGGQQTKNGRCKKMAERQDVATAVKHGFVEGGERALPTGTCGLLDATCRKGSVAGCHVGGRKLENGDEWDGRIASSS